MFDESGTLLYVGVAGNPMERFSEHRRDKQWWAEIASITIESHPTRESALAAEIRAIRTESPRYNVVGVDSVRIPVPPERAPERAPSGLMTAAQVAEALSVTRATIYNLMHRGMPSLKVGRCRRFRWADVEAWLIDNNEVAA
jgi:excisionase family DNA binding protein